MMIRQGDVLLVKLEDSEVPAAFMEPPRETAAAVLALGEHTGHSHVLHGTARFYRSPDIFHMPRGGTLKHQQADGSQADHNPIRLARGWYRQVQQREYVEPTRADPARTRRVYD